MSRPYRCTHVTYTPGGEHAACENEEEKDRGGTD